MGVSFGRVWANFWARYSSPSFFGKMASRLACVTARPHKAAVGLAKVSRKGMFVAPSATVSHRLLVVAKNIYIGDRVLIFQNKYRGIEGGEISLGRDVRILRDSILETAQGASITIGEGTAIHPRCQINAYLSSIHIGRNVDIAPNCALYSYNHGVKKDQAIREQPLVSKGPIVIEDDVWIGVGVIVLGGVTVGKGAVIGAGSVVTRDVPASCIVAGVPAKILGVRS